MGKPKAQVQKEYRERKKAKEGETYLAKERARQKKNYVKVEDLKSDDAKKRRRKTRERVRKHRQAKKEITKNVDVLIVAWDFRKKGRKCVSRRISKSKRIIAALKEQKKP